MSFVLIWRRALNFIYIYFWIIIKILLSKLFENFKWCIGEMGRWYMVVSSYPCQPLPWVPSLHVFFGLNLAYFILSLCFPLFLTFSQRLSLYIPIQYFMSSQFFFSLSTYFLLENSFLNFSLIFNLNVLFLESTSFVLYFDSWWFLWILFGFNSNFNIIYMLYL